MDLALPLIATSDDRMLDDALRWCAAVGCAPEVAADVVAVRRSWRAAPLVVVGDDLGPDLVHAQLPRRDHVLLMAGSRDEAWPLAVALGAVDVVTGADEARALDALTLALDGRGEACLVSLVGGVGGAGASTVAASLALAGADRGFQSLLLDADPLGGGLELVLGAEAVDGLRWHDLGAADGPWRRSRWPRCCRGRTRWPRCRGVATDRTRCLRRSAVCWPRPRAGSTSWWPTFPGISSRRAPRSSPDRC